MTRLVLILVTTSLLAACGADGEPEQPTMNAGIAVSGNGNNHGGIGFNQGPISLYFGF